MKIYLIAGEASGDRLGAALMAGLRQIRSDLQFHGVAGPLMQAEGMTSLFPMEELSIMGLAEILPKYFDLKRRIRETASDVVHVAPDVLITIDSPDFCLRVAKLVKAKCPIRTVHYVAPSVWAWRPGRAAKMARVIDHVLALLPFEPPYMESEGMTCDFVGHPAVSSPHVSKKDQEKFKKKYNLHNGPIITVLPGSRIGEIKRMCPIFNKVLNNIEKLYPDSQFILPVASSVEKDVINAVKSWNIKPLLLLNEGKDLKELEHDKFITYSISSAALATSGTVSLELAAKKCPMIVAYKANWITTKMVKKLAKIDTANLINIITDTKVIPEHLFESCTVENITESLRLLLNNDNNQIKAMEETMNRLGASRKDIHLLAANSVLSNI